MYCRLVGWLVYVARCFGSLSESSIWTLERIHMRHKKRLYKISWNYVDLFHSVSLGERDFVFPVECKGIITNRNKFPAVYAARFSSVCCISMRYRMFPTTLNQLCASARVINFSIAGCYTKAVIMILANIFCIIQGAFRPNSRKEPLNQS